MLGCKLTNSEVATDGSFDVTAMVGLAGQMCGVFTVRCNANSATLIVSKMLGLEPAQGSKDVLDAMHVLRKSPMLTARARLPSGSKTRH